MGQLLLFIVVALVVAAIVFGVTVMVSGGDPGLTPVEPDGKALPLPVDRPLVEEDVTHSRFDMAFRGYRMAQVDQALQRAAYDIGYKNELIGVLEAEVTALREGRTADADTLRRAREASAAPAVAPAPVIDLDKTPRKGDESATQVVASSTPAAPATSSTSASPSSASTSTTSTSSASPSSASADSASTSSGSAASGEKAASASDEEPAERR
ncbi:DivIVA domain-containing protein [Actinoplanes sp. RD1]|uniref:DivIVA domain-containing protein n=1 Tax=Actinoplanes sp. RD1 TaxID=3064538 RepID=UPI00274193E6|nr:DivIVA domain-containing protein [Actinoplanes sp. RD1]